MSESAKAREAGQRGSGLFGSLKDALAAASREEHAGAALAAFAGRSKAADAQSAPQSTNATLPAVIALAPPPVPSTSVAASESTAVAGSENAPVAAKSPREAGASLPSAEEAARAVRGSVTLRREERHAELGDPPTTRVVRKPVEAKVSKEETGEPRTQLVRGRQKLARTDFSQDPVVGWLVVVGGPGLGAFRPVFEGNNTVGRAASNRIAVDFGDDAISAEAQAYIRYDSTDRSFLFVPNLAKTNVVSVNDKRPTGAVELAHMDVITMGRTQLVFVPFCGADFDWAELAEVKD